MRIEAENFLTEKLGNAFLILSTLLLMALAAISLGWQIHNVALFNYLAWLRQYGYLPYRDIFDLNFPGTYFFYSLLTEIAGFSNLGFRIFDLCWLLLLMMITYLLMRDFSKRVGYAAALFTGLMYLVKGPTWSQERDFILILPVALAFWVYFNSRISSESWRLLLVGFLLGGASCVKPPAGLALIAFFRRYKKETLPTTGQFSIEEHEFPPHPTSPQRGEEKVRGLFPQNTDPLPSQGVWFRLGWLASGFIILPVFCLGWLYFQGILPKFWEIMTNYLPLYNQLKGDLTVYAGQERWFEILFKIHKLYPVGMLFAPASLGAYVIVLGDDALAPRIYCLFNLWLLFLVYTIIGGKFWLYQWFPVEYFTVLLLSLCFIDKAPHKALRYTVVIWALIFHLYPLKQTLSDSFSNQVNQEDNEISAYLKINSQPGDKVQGMSMMGQVIAGIYAAQLQPATPYLYSLVFSQHLTNPYIKGLRADFLNRLRQAQPRFIVFGYSGNLRRDFPDLENFIESNYSPAARGRNYQIWRRNL